MKNRYWLLTVGVMACALAMSACGARTARKKDNKGQETAAAKTEDADSAYTPDINVTEASLRSGEFVAAQGLETIFFDYDSSSLKGDALETLKQNAEHLKKNRKLEVLVAGFCDERGTIEYNLALGQRRAKEVREYYIRLGVSGKQIATISYGKESPTCGQATEDCWAANRRAETRVRAATASNGNRKVEAPQ